MAEYWLGVRDFPNYEVSHLGRVRNKKTQRLLKPRPAGRGYHQVSLRAHNKTFPVYVHHLVASVFIRPRKAGEEVNHRDCNKKHNGLFNLEYVTHGDNLAHARAHGRMKVGALHPMAKLNAGQVAVIRMCSNLPHAWLAARFSVNRRTIDRICKRELWNV